MADEEEMTHSSNDEEEEEYEYDYSDDDEGSSYAMDCDDVDGEKPHSNSKQSSSTDPVVLSDNPNAAPLMSREDVFGGAGNSGGLQSDFGAKVDASRNSDSITILDSSQLMLVMKKRLLEVTEVLSIPTSAAAIILREHKWLRERLFEDFLSDPEKIKVKCGVKARCDAMFEGSTKKGKFIDRTCNICMDEYSPSEMFAMPCQHAFCKDCWQGYIVGKIGDGPSCVRATCPQDGCLEAVTEEEVSALAPESITKFEEYQLRSFVEMNGMMRWCPGIGCTKVAMANSAGYIGIAECTCSTQFCIRCGEEPHAPTTCPELAKWREKCRNESETANWILANTKSCPKCNTRIEKNQGCNHMNCQQCKFEFCWICLGEWSQHGANTGGYYKCNKYDPSKLEDNSDAAKAKRELDKYLHYYKRYHNHAMAQKFAVKQLKDTEEKMVLLQESSDNSTWADVEFLKSAAEQLIKCRRVLKYTYAFAYYLDDGTKKKQRFEHHQEMLEKFTESLSELTEVPIANMNRTDVVNHTRVVDKFMKNVLNYVEDGMEEE